MEIESSEGGIELEPQELLDRLRGDHLSTELAVETAIAVYQETKAQQDAWAAVGSAAKALIEEVMEETGRTSITTPAGKAQVTSPSVTITYDSKALEALCESSEELKRILSPHRKVSQRAGSLRITASK